MGMRKCSQCGKTGHNSRTCRNLRRIQSVHSLKLFGVQLVSTVPSSDEGFISFSPAGELLSSDENSDHKLNNGLAGAHQGRRKKGVAWSEEEHRLFLLGLEKLGKGDWRGIARNFVTTRTSTQVASHAQKYFLRQNNANKRKHRPPFFSMVEGNIEPQVVQSVVSTTGPIYYSTMKLPICPLLPENITCCRLFNSSATQSQLSLELSLSAPEPPVWNCPPVGFWKKQYVI